MSGVIYSSEEANTLQDTKQLQHQSFNNQIIFEVLIKLSRDPTVSSSIRDKLHDTIMHSRIQHSLELKTPKDDHQALLGLNDLQTPDFTYDEQQTVAKLVDERLLDLLKELQDRKKQEVGNDCATDDILLELHCNLRKTMSTYASNLLEYQKILESMKTLRADCLPEVFAAKESGTKLQQQMNILKSKLLEYSAQIHICTENDVSLGAYKKFMESIRDEEQKIEIDVKQMKDLMTKYKMADCQEYQEVLKEYLEYLNAIERIERMQKLMNNK